MTTRTCCLALVLAAFVAAGCTSTPSAPPPAAAPTGKSVDPATAGSISGKVTFTGARPPLEYLKMGSDQACVQSSGPNPASDAVLIAKDGALQNAFVYIKSGLDPAYTFDVPTAAVRLDQKGCRYQPRVLGVRVGQPMEIVNQDPTMHNVHAMPMQNQEFNQMQIAQGSRMVKTFTVPEVMVRFKCNVHGWMEAWVGVMAHPFFAVTAADGSFSLTGVPPGTYTIEAWHERFGTQTAQVIVGSQETKTVSLSLSAKTATPAR